jgi:hypothetical protein
LIKHRLPILRLKNSIAKFDRKIRHSPSNKQLHIKELFFTKNNIFLEAIEIICTFARSKTENNIKQHLKLTKNEEISSYTRTGLPLHGGLQQHSQGTRPAC